MLLKSQRRSRRAADECCCSEHVPSLITAGGASPADTEWSPTGSARRQEIELMTKSASGCVHLRVQDVFTCVCVCACASEQQASCKKRQNANVTTEIFILAKDCFQRDDGTVLL